MTRKQPITVSGIRADDNRLTTWGNGNRVAFVPAVVNGPAGFELNDRGVRVILDNTELALLIGTAVRATELIADPTLAAAYNRMVTHLGAAHMVIPVDVLAHSPAAQA
jgi:hypothetical protein